MAPPRASTPPAWQPAPCTRTGVPFPWRAAVVVPIRVGGLLWGALGAVSMEGSRLTEDAEERLSRFAELAGLAVANADVRERLVRQARTDPLTGLPHHGTFHRQLDEEIARTARFGSVLSLAVIDIDHFKTVNDAHGHEVGDATLRAVAARLSAHARVVDLAARVGGEEFGWLMPGTPLPGARAAAERFRAAVAGERLRPGGDAHRLGGRRAAHRPRSGRVGAVPSRGRRALRGESRRTGPHDGGRAGVASGAYGLLQERSGARLPRPA